MNIISLCIRIRGIKGTDIQVKTFDDRIVVESPGSLPGIVRLNNIRQVHFSRNPKIAAFLHEYNYVQEFGEGVDRMYQEMEKAGLPAPEYKDVSFMLNATIRNCINMASGTNGAASGTNGAASGTNGAASDINDERNFAQTGFSKNELLVYNFLKANPEASTRMIASSIKLSTRTVQRCIAALMEKSVIENQGTRQRVKWLILDSPPALQK